MKKYLAYYENEWPANIAELTAVENKPFVGYLKDKEVMFTVIPEPVAEGPADNEIWYTTVDGSIIETTAPIDSEWGMMFGTKMVSNTYENGIGIMKFEDDLTFIGPFAFTGNQKLKTIILPSKITRIETWDPPFGGCTSLISIVLPDNLEYIGDMVFSGCSALQAINIPNNVTTIGSEAFNGCSSLTSITIPNSVTSIGDYAFWNCSSLTKTNYTGDIAGWCNIKFGSGANPIYYSHNFYINDQEIKDLVIPNSITSIGDEAFAGCSSLTSVTIPNSVTSIGYQAFSGCSSLTSVTIGNSVTSIGYQAFSNCSSLTSVTIGNSVTSIRDCAFWNCSSLTSITIPNSVTSIGIDTFRYCSKLTSVIWNAKNCADFSDYTHAPFYNLSSKITSFTFGDSVQHIPEALCYGMKNLTSITIPNSVTSIGRYAFRECYGLTSINIPDSVTSIGESVFYNCSSLTSITIGNSVTSIGERTFYNCIGLTSITYEGTQEQWNAITKGSNWNDNTSATYVQCSDGQVAL